MGEEETKKLTESFNELRVTLARIEVGIKPIDEIKQDVGLLKIGFTNMESSLKSAHKRIDETNDRVYENNDRVEKQFQNVPTYKEFAEHGKRISKIEAQIGKVSWLIISTVILALIALVIVRT